MLNDQIKIIVIFRKTDSLMHQIAFTYFLLLVLAPQFSLAQSEFKTLYKGSNGNTVVIPLGEISFADEIVSFNIGNPKPLAKYQDSSQALHEPNYINIKNPNFVSLGCGGQITLRFTDNGFMNLPGDDLYIFEVGPAKEPASIEISSNGKDWTYAGKTKGGKSSVDLSLQDIATDIVFYYVRITDLKSVCNSATAGADIDAVGAINSVIELNIDADVLFDIASSKLRSTATDILDSISTTIKKIPAASILIQGHTDNDGGHEYNMNLSRNRSLAVNKGLREILEATSNYDYEVEFFGKTIPRVPNDSGENKQLNRRVEIRVYPPKSYYESLEK